MFGGDPPEMLMRRLWLACAAAVVIGPGYAVGADGWRFEEKNSVRLDPGENDARRCGLWSFPAESLGPCEDMVMLGRNYADTLEVDGAGADGC